MLKGIKYFVMTLFLVGIIVMGGLLGVGYSAYSEVVDVISVEAYVEAIRTKEGYTPIEDVDQDFLNAIVAVEDHRFYKHGAIDLIGMMRAVVTNVAKGELVQGGSSITQQLAKNMYFGSEQTLERKLGELFVAYNLELAYTKQEILELYINKIYFGNGCYGIGAASTHFLDKTPSDLTIEEAAMLAGLPQSPSRYAGNQDLAKERQQVVLNAMESSGYME